MRNSIATVAPVGMKIWKRDSGCRRRLAL